ncbi:hypothetical protein EVAR_93209_1 [Eumeta japonica]|uniref:Uncharacterized protein n=1 Tax=Eumeta variegata TaxID=151549 RepID=A0A4C1TXJ6_EUMVA|nr:hypothetical protein EVAR_93209_1 [Eumeta japonica]
MHPALRRQRARAGARQQAGVNSGRCPPSIQIGRAVRRCLPMICILSSRCRPIHVFAYSKGKQASEKSESRRSPPPMDTRNPVGIPIALPAPRKLYLIKEDRVVEGNREEWGTKSKRF